MGKDRSETIAALDPGRDKCGFAVLNPLGVVLFKKIISTSDLESEILEFRNKFNFDLLIMGNGTTSKAAKSLIENCFKDLTVKIVDEYKTTELARGEYFKENPPKGWRRLLPLTMQTPPVPVDDYAAVVLARRFFGSEEIE